MLTPKPRHAQMAARGDDRPGVIILGNEYQALGLLRELSTQGVRCVLVDQDRWGPARFSRYHRPFYHAPRYTDELFWPWLVALAREHGYLGWVLIATDDEQVRQIAEHYEEARQLFRYAGLPWPEYRYIYDKRLASDWAGQLGIAMPLTFVPTRRDEMPGSAIRYPGIVKPAIKRTYSLYSKQKAIRFDSPAELRQTLDQTLAPVPIEELLYQELIPGDGQYQWSYAGFFVQGSPIAAFTACRQRQHPPDFGRASTYVIAVHEPEVEAESRRVLERLNYTGLAEVEWKRDRRDGRLLFLEVNARCWGWHSLASQVVGNLPIMLYDYLVCGTTEAVRPAYGSRWVKWITDVPVAGHLVRRRELSWREYLASLRGNIVSCEWDRRDPWPFFIQFALAPYLMAKRGY